MSWVPFIIADSNVVKHLVYLSGGLADTIEVQNGLTAIMKNPLILYKPMPLSPVHQRTRRCRQVP